METLKDFMDKKAVGDVLEQMAAFLELKGENPFRIRAFRTAARAFGRGLVHAMPVLLSALSLIGTAAMLWVGGGIFSHGLEEFGLGVVPHTIHDVAVMAGNAVPAPRAGS